MLAFIKSHSILWTKALGVSLLAIVAPAKALVLGTIVLTVVDLVIGRVTRCTTGGSPGTWKTFGAIS